MTKVVIIGDMTLGETTAPPGTPTQPIAPGGPAWGRPIDPGFGNRPGRPTDPDYGVDEGEGGEAGQLPIWPIGPDHGLPPVAGRPLPPINPPPGTVWPPLPPSVPPGKTLVYAGIVGVGKRWFVVDVPPHKPDQGLPGRPGRPEPGRPDQGLPPSGGTKPVEPDEPEPEPHNRRR